MVESDPELIQKWEFPVIATEASAQQPVLSVKAAASPEAPDRRQVGQQQSEDLAIEAELSRLRQQLAQEKAVALEQSQRDGYQQGLQQALQEQAARLAQFANILDQLQTELDAWVEQMPAVLNSIVKQLVSAIFQAELKLAPELYEKLLQEALGYVPATDGNLILKLNPEILELIRAQLATKWPKIELVPDPEVAMGCIKLSSVDASITNDLNARLAQVLADYCSD